MNKKKVLIFLGWIGVVAIVAISLMIWWVEKTNLHYLNISDRINEKVWKACENEPITEVTITLDNGDKMTFHSRYSCVYIDKETKILNFLNSLQVMFVFYIIVIIFLFVGENIKRKRFLMK